MDNKRCSSHTSTQKIPRVLRALCQKPGQRTNMYYLLYHNIAEGAQAAFVLLLWNQLFPHLCGLQTGERGHRVLSQTEGCLRPELGVQRGLCRS